MIDKSNLGAETKMNNAQSLQAGSALLNDAKNDIVSLAFAFSRVGNKDLYEELMEISRNISIGNELMYNSWLDMMESNNSTLSGINGKLLEHVLGGEAS